MSPQEFGIQIIRCEQKGYILNPPNNEKALSIMKLTIPSDSGKTGSQQLEGLKGEHSLWRKDPEVGGSWGSGRYMQANGRDPQGSGHQQLRQVTNSWAAAEQELTQLSVPPSQSSSHLSAGSEAEICGIQH